MFRTRALVVFVVILVGAVSLTTNAIVLCVVIASRGGGWNLVKYGLFAVAGVLTAALMIILLVRTFRAEVAEREASYQRHRDKDAPPWARQ